MFSIIKIKTMEERLAFIGPLGFYFVNNLKYFFIIHHADLMKKCINHMRGDWMEAVGESEQTVMLESADVGRKLTQVCALFMYSGAIFFQAEKMIEPAPVNSLNVTIRRHIVPRYDYVVDSQISPVYELAYGTHLMYAIFLYTIEVAVCNLATVFVGHICGQVQVMRLKLEQLEQCAIYNNHKGIDDFIASVIQCHVKIFTGNVRTALSEICLVEAIYSVGIICWLEFFCLKGLNDSDILSIITYSTLFLSLSINIFILCYIGEILKNQSESVAELTYRIDWCQIPQRKLSPFILLISMARYPRNITAGGMMEMTLGSFGVENFVRIFPNVADSHRPGYIIFIIILRRKLINYDYPEVTNKYN
ncbi:uncharacterized protein [Fopius arisanus]|uniref:Odorant receptor n=1 Tax=Fopius arisanus TaxID=64838 RepID=A0A9R1TGH4_9HYME|nr:PREDICTED: uncharacterized protein LOC105269800 [Fopius arisanus]